MGKLKICCKNCMYGMALSDECEIYKEMKEFYGFKQWEKIKVFEDEDRSESGCEYKCRYIEYPLKVLNGINTEKIVYNKQSTIGNLVKVRLCSGNKTYLGLYLGDLPTCITVSHNEENSVLNVSPSMYNPAILIPELNKIVFGFESWWGFIKSAEDLKDISDIDINNVWYVKLLENLEE